MRKKTTSKQALRWELYKAAPIVSESYPSVSSISVTKTFHEDSGNKQIGETTIWNIPIATMRALFDVECPMGCIDGGYDLTHEIISMIGKQETQKKGRLVCQGWQDKEREGQYRCLSDLVYEITITYK